RKGARAEFRTAISAHANVSFSTKSARSCRSLRLKVQRAAERLLSQTVDLTSQTQRTTTSRPWYRSIRTALTGHSIADTTLRRGFRISTPHASRRILQSAVLPV
ncbi:hypothetical protein, partial [Pseudosulfitobacter pseudonitzschiae]|uniref:hypothetical protein n=1 Tax=Pseudosulfitobacter pseudonitzschiae TaxID=1402135 RepID=UPI001E454384